MANNTRNILIKLSGNLYNDHPVLEEIDKLSDVSNVTLITGFGREYGKRLNAVCIPFHFENGIRVIDNPEQEQEAFRIGYYLQTEIQNRLKERLPKILGFLSCISTDESGNLTNTNGDDLVRKHASEYDERIVYSLKDKPHLKGIANIRMIRYK
jgi:hypothetical protein